MTERLQRCAVVLLACLFASAALHARVISYAPYSDRVSLVAHQNRMDRYFVVVESAPNKAQYSNPPNYGQMVVYDSTGAEEPRELAPTSDEYMVFTAVGVREAEDGTLSIFAQAGAPNQNGFTSYFSNDSGKTWKTLDLPAAIAQLGTTGPDNGGPFASYRFSQVRIGTADYPFVVATPNAVYSISRIGLTRKLYESASNTVMLAGRNGAGSEFLVRSQSNVIGLTLDGVTRPIMSPIVTPPSLFEGFIANDGSAYIEERPANNTNGAVWFAQSGQQTKLFDSTWPYDQTSPSAYVVPSFDYANAWAIQRGGGHPTVLYRITSGTPTKMWEDITAPEVEALHAGSSGNKLLIQVHRPRPNVDTMFHDPALAVWNVGDPAPRAYDELFMDEQPSKGFVHLDVEKIAAGALFVFDSGAASSSYCCPGGGIIISPPPVSGGSDVTQEWGVVRASLKQELVLPAVGRTKGAFGSDWSSDVIIQNPIVDAEQHVLLHYVPMGVTTTSLINDVTLTLAPGEIRMIKDIVGTLFGVENGIGAMFIDPEAGVAVTSRTYTHGGGGTFGFGMGAVDVLAAAASPRFPVTFSGAFPGPDFRTNVSLTDTSGRGTDAVLAAAGSDGAMGSSDFSISVGPNGHQQANFVGASLGIQPYQTGALMVRPTRGTGIASVFAIDNRTNDSTYFPPDLPAPPTGSRVVPAIGHLDGANGSHFRTDLYLYNSTNIARTFNLWADPWDHSTQTAYLTLTLLPNEARVIHDVLQTAFGLTGIARLRVVAQGGSSGGGVRFTSRTYNVDPSGGTYGFLMPPLNSFQIGALGDTLEILGAVADPNFRTNIGLVQTSETGNSANATAKIEILDASSQLVDSFTVNFPMMGGTQLNDVFRARGLTITGPVLIRVTPQNGVIGAYATVTDNVTNDSSYLAANLAAKQ